VLLKLILLSPTTTSSLNNNSSSNWNSSWSCKLKKTESSVVIPPFESKSSKTNSQTTSITL
jgi:hypothetical protein